MVDQLPAQEHAQKKRSNRWILFVVPIVLLIVLGAVFFYIYIRQNADQIINNSVNTNQTSPYFTLDTSPYQGSPDAKVVIVEFADFQCPYCYEAFPIVREVMSAYGDRIKFVYRDFPLSSSHPDAEKSAEAGKCAQAQGKFWEMHDKMFINHLDLSISALERYAGEIGLDVAVFKTCLESGQKEAAVRKDFSDGYLAGVDGTPTFFVNGRKIEGSPTFDNFKSIIDGLLGIYSQNS